MGELEILHYSVFVTEHESNVVVIKHRSNVRIIIRSMFYLPVKGAL